MREIVILGRGGQGAQTAGNQLARAFFAEGFYVQTFATYGGARRGTPVMSSLRIDEAPIRLRSNIECASAILCFDQSLLEPGLLSLADDKTLIMVNSERPHNAFKEFKSLNIHPVDGRGIARRNDMGKVVNSALLGAFAAAMGAPGLAMLSDVIEATSPAKQRQNVAACREAYQQFQHPTEVAI